LCISKSLLLNLPGKEEGPKPGNFPLLLLEEELKSFLLQVDQAIGISQLLLMGTLGNFTLSKRSEILEKSSVNKFLKKVL
jgi:hypothetical protein